MSYNLISTDKDIDHRALTKDKIDGVKAQCAAITGGLSIPPVLYKGRLFPRGNVGERFLSRTKAS